MEINADKCIMIAFKYGKDDISFDTTVKSIFIEGKAIQEVSRYIYLGIVTDTDLPRDTMANGNCSKGFKTFSGMII